MFVVPFIFLRIFKIHFKIFFLHFDHLYFLALYLLTCVFSDYGALLVLILQVLDLLGTLIFNFVLLSLELHAFI